jgi:hypothetical protein
LMRRQARAKIEPRARSASYAFLATSGANRSNANLVLSTLDQMLVCLNDRLFQSLKREPLHCYSIGG